MWCFCFRFSLSKQPQYTLTGSASLKRAIYVATDAFQVIQREFALISLLSKQHTAAVTLHVKLLQHFKPKL